jgi:hypothetical protein
MPKLTATLGTIIGPVIPNTVFNLNDTVTTTLSDDHMGLLVVGILPDDICAVFRVDDGSLVVISAETTFTTNPAIPNRYYCFFSGGYFNVMNKVGDAKTLKVSMFGLERVTG